MVPFKQTRTLLCHFDVREVTETFDITSFMDLFIDYGPFNSLSNNIFGITQPNFNENIFAMTFKADDDSKMLSNECKKYPPNENLYRPKLILSSKCGFPNSPIPKNHSLHSPPRHPGSRGHSPRTSSQRWDTVDSNSPQFPIAEPAASEDFEKNKRVREDLEVSLLGSQELSSSVVSVGFGRVFRAPQVQICILVNLID
ncbi:unnamed protein product [Clavelina lepadiformis]|uniref:Uncharacterized protein n=1 Tax=Clavelina lepadiformis TaxID=159417 RepID=A0ABP0FZP2_CLALP